MTRYALLLRGVNVGGRTKVAMADLRAVLGDLGFGDVQTVLQSGNAVFSADGEPDEGVIQAAVAERTGVGARCLVRTGGQLKGVVDGHPFREVADDGSRMVAVFLDAEPDPGLVAEHGLDGLDPGRAVLEDRVVYQWCPDGISKSPPVVPFVERRWQVTGTARNWNTVMKLYELVQRPTA
ncbi:DUF1697 domain-containing protein [Actinokineospora sp. NPDC004072]